MRRISDIVRNQKPLILRLDVTVTEAAAHMRERGVGAVLVVDNDDRLVGIFTGRDAVCRVLAEGKAPGKTDLKQVMIANPDTIPSRNPAIDALRLMQDAHYRHLPIVDDGEVVGIVSCGDFRGLELDRLDEETGLWERIEGDRSTAQGGRSLAAAVGAPSLGLASRPSITVPPTRAEPFRSTLPAGVSMAER